MKYFLSCTVAACFVLAVFALPLLGQEQEKTKQTKSDGVPKSGATTKRMSMPMMAMIIPGVDPKTNSELLRLGRDHRLAVTKAAGTNELATLFATVHASVDRLYDQHKSDIQHPKTAELIVGRKLKFYIDAIRLKVPDASQKLDAYVASMQETAPESEATATAVGMKLYHLKISKKKPGADKEKLIGEYLQEYQGKSWGGRLVFMYGAILASSEGPDSRLKWLKRNIKSVSESDASTIRRELARAKLLGSTATLSGPMMNGENFDLKILRGKVVLIDFWATWCGPCVQEMPEVKKVYDKYKDQGFEVVGISLDRSREPIEEFLDENEYDWIQVYIDDKEVRKQITERFGVIGIPATFLIDQQGKIIEMNLRGHQRIGKAVSKLLDTSVETIK